MSTMQELRLPSDYDPPSFYCPACGTGIVGNFDSQICKHVVIVTNPAGSGDDYVGEAYKDLVEKIQESDPSTLDADLVTKVLENVDKDSFLKYSIEFGGYSHGGDSWVITAVFDLSPSD